MMDRTSSNHDTREPLRVLLLGFLVLSPVVFWHDLVEPFEAVKATFTQLTALAILVLAAGLIRTRGTAWAAAQFRALFAGPIGMATLMGLASALVSTVLSLSPRTSLLGARDSNMGLPTALALTVLFAASRSVCRDWRTVRCLLQASVLGFVLSFAYAAVQMLGHDPLAWSKTWDFHGWTRPSGTQGHPNYLAGHAVMVLPIVLGMLRQSRNVRDPFPLVACTLLTLMVVVTVLATLSRSCLVAGGIVATLVLVGTGAHTPRRRTLLLLGSALVVGACVLTFTGQFAHALGQRIREIASSPGRWPIWEGAVQLFVEHPWTGCGLDTFGLAWPRVRTEAYWEVEWGFMPVKAHNEFLHTLATQGILGAGSHLLFWSALAWGLARVCRRGLRDGVVVLGGIVVAFFVQNLVGFSVATTAGLLAIVSGMIAAQEDLGGPEAEPTVIPSLLPGVAGLGVIVLLLVLWQGSFRLEIWRVALVGIVSSWAAVLVVLASPGDSRSAMGFESRGALSWRPFWLPACAGLILAWFLMSPLLASGLSFQAERWLPTDPARAWALHERAVRLVPQTALLHERRARAAWQASARASNPTSDPIS